MKYLSTCNNNSKNLNLMCGIEKKEKKELISPFSLSLLPSQVKTVREKSLQFDYRLKDSILPKIKCNPFLISKNGFVFTQQVFEKGKKIKKIEFNLFEKQKKEEEEEIQFSIMLFDLMKNETKLVGNGVISKQRRKPTKKEEKKLQITPRLESKPNEIQNIFQRHLEFNEIALPLIESPFLLGVSIHTKTVALCLTKEGTHYVYYFNEKEKKNKNIQKQKGGLLLSFVLW